MKPRSLRVRLLLGAAVAIFVALAAAWIVMTLLFERHIERRVHADLVRDGMQLAANLSIGSDGEPLLSREPGDVRFAEPASGLYWQVTTSRGRSALALLVGPVPARHRKLAEARMEYAISSGPFEEQLLLVERDREARARWARGAASSSRLRTSHCTKHGASSAPSWRVFLVLLWAILSAAAWTQVVLGSEATRAHPRQVR